jgi:hypothetical protein
MKKFIVLWFVTLMLGIGGGWSATAQTKQKPRAKDLYVQYNDGDSTFPGNPGAKVSVLLKRGNQEKVVSTNETFQSGDRIKLIFDINFSGYVAIMNQGSTGKEQLLFPYKSNGRLVDSRVTPNAGTKLPGGGDWIVFDNNPGNETVTVIFSNTPFEEFNNLSSGSITTGSEADQVLAELNSKSLRRSKDLYVQSESDGTYCVTQNGSLNGPVQFTFTLRHQ